MVVWDALGEHMWKEVDTGSWIGPVCHISETKL